MSKRGTFKDLEGEKEHVYTLRKIVNLGRKCFTGSNSEKAELKSIPQTFTKYLLALGIQR